MLPTGHNEHGNSGVTSTPLKLTCHQGDWENDFFLISCLVGYISSLFFLRIDPTTKQKKNTHNCSKNSPPQLSLEGMKKMWKTDPILVQGPRLFGFFPDLVHLPAYWIMTARGTSANHMLSSPVSSKFLRQTVLSALFYKKSQSKVRCFRRCSTKLPHDLSLQYLPH